MAQRVKSKVQGTTPRTPKARPLATNFLPLHTTLEVAVAFWEGLGTPVALSCAILCREGEYSQLVRKSVDPKQYMHAADFKKDYAAVRYLAKVKGLIDDAILEDEALRGFKAAEDRCASTNLRLTNGNPLHGGVEGLIFKLREKISCILGKLDLAEVVSLCKWGPGATATLKGEQVRPEEKLLESRLSVTRRLWPLARAIVSADLHWCRARLGPDVEGPCTLLPTEFQWVEYMRVVTVDKDSKTKRTIGAEPTLNTYVQQGIGRAIRKRLRRVGIDLDNQRINQGWAELAVELGLATVDLSAASDLISYWLVELLLPPAWFELLDMARSGYASMPDGKTISLNKFSSMGNGYTFELETLIFYAITQVVVEEVGAVPAIVSVYGDDIILPGAAYSRLCEVFQVFGFKVNPEKSYASGQFYESCGEHYFGGANVTPVYQKELLRDLPELVRAANRLYRWAASGAGHVHVDRSVASAVESCTKYMHQALEVRAHGPHKGPWPDRKLPVAPWGTEGDGGLWVTRVRGFYCPDRGYLCKSVNILPKEVETISYEALLAVTFQRTRAKAAEEYYDLGLTRPWHGRILDARVRRACARVVMPALRNAAAVEGEAPDTSYNGVVTLRGDTGYRLAHRWIRPSATRSVTIC